MIKSCGPTGRILPLVMLLLAVLFPGLCTAFSTPGIDLLGLGTNVGAIVVASAEVMEDFESIGHGHGMMLLAGSKICREINLMREATSEGLEELGELKVQTSFLSSAVLKPFTLFLRLLTNRIVASSLAVAALGAAFVEVMEDAKPGGHHGAVLLAINELLELLEEAKIVTGRALLVLRNRVFRLALVGGATVVALMETIASIKTGQVGAHHGVLLLGCSKTLRCIGLIRGEYKRRTKTAASGKTD